jgi:hypothetical protein
MLKNRKKPLNGSNQPKILPLKILRDSPFKRTAKQ